jgi:hypothetical protein
MRTIIRLLYSAAICALTVWQGLSAAHNISNSADAVLVKLSANSIAVTTGKRPREWRTTFNATVKGSDWVVNSQSTYDSASKPKAYNETYYKHGTHFRLALSSADRSIPDPEQIKLWPQAPYSQWQIDHAEFCMFVVDAIANQHLDKSAISEALTMGVLKCPHIEQWQTDATNTSKLFFATLLYDCRYNAAGERFTIRNIRCENWTNVLGREFPATVSIETRDYWRDSDGKTLAGDTNNIIISTFGSPGSERDTTELMLKSRAKNIVADYRFFERSKPYAVEYEISDATVLPPEDSDLIKGAFLRLDKLLKEERALQVAPTRYRLAGLTAFILLASLSVYIFRKSKLI